MVSKCIINPLANIQLSPPNKKPKEGLKQKGEIQETNTKDLEIRSLETKNFNLNQAVEKKQEQLTKQANIIGDLRGQIYQLELNIVIKNTEKDNSDEVFNMKQTLEAAKRKIFALEQEALHLAEENKQIKVRANKEIDDLEDFIKEHEKGVSRKKKNLEITIQEKDDFIRHLTQKLKSKKDPSPVTTESEIEEQEDGRDEGETEEETTEANPWQVKQGTTFICPICNYTRRTESQIKKHMKVHDEIDKETGQKQSQVDECVTNVRCEGNCNHVSNHKVPNHEEITQVTCYDCKKQFKDKATMMDHKRDSDHPSKRKCNRLPDCEKGSKCWFVHSGQVRPQTSSRAPANSTVLTCRDCEQVFSDRNDLMFHKKRAHPSNIMCSNFLNGYCRRGVSGEFCWWRHDQLQAPAPSVERPQTSLPSPGSPSWNLDFPVNPTIGQNPVVGLQQQMVKMLEQQELQQQQQQQQMNVLMKQLMSLNM